MAMPLLSLTIDVNGIGTVLPVVQRELDVPTGSVAWLVSSTSLTMAATLILVGRLAPLVGNRRLVLTGAVVFGCSSLACGVAPTFWLLIAARVGQGVGGVLMFTTSLAVINAAFDDRRRPAAIGAWGLVNGVGGALGPVVAGIATTASWRAFFLVNVPLCLIAVPVMFRFTPRDRPEASSGSLPLVRLGLLGAALVALNWGFQNTADEGWTAPATVATLGLATAALAGLVVATRRGLEPLLFAGVTRAPRFLAANFVAFSANWGFGVTIVFGGLFLQNSQDRSPFAAGMIFTSFSLACALAGLSISTIHRRWGLTRAMAGAMVVIVASLAVGVTVLAPSAPIIVVTAFLVLSGFGQGLAFDLSTLAALDGVPDSATAEGAGVLSVVRSMGFTIGIALSTTLAVAVEVDGSAEEDLTFGAVGLQNASGEKPINDFVDG